MGKRGPKPKPKVAAAAPPPPPAKGKGPMKRTPTSAFDPAAKDDDVYQCKMHGDLQKSAKDTTLEHSLFAAFNTD